MNKYEIDDLLDIKNGKSTLQEIADKYETTPKAIQMALNRNGIYLNKKIIIIHSPYGSKKCVGIKAVAKELNLSQWSIKQALKGKTLKTLKDLDIKLEVINNGEK